VWLPEPPWTGEGVRGFQIEQISRDPESRGLSEQFLRGGGVHLPSTSTWGSLAVYIVTLTFTEPGSRCVLGGCPLRLNPAAARMAERRQKKTPGQVQAAYEQLGFKFHLEGDAEITMCKHGREYCSTCCVDFRGVNEDEREDQEKARRARKAGAKRGGSGGGGGAGVSGRSGFLSDAAVLDWAKRVRVRMPQALPPGHSMFGTHGTQFFAGTRVEAPFGPAVVVGSRWLGEDDGGPPCRPEDRCVFVTPCYILEDGSKALHHAQIDEVHLSWPEWAAEKRAAEQRQKKSDNPVAGTKRAGNHQCSQCTEFLGAEAFSANQLRKKSKKRCSQCVEGGNRPKPSVVSSAAASSPNRPSQIEADDRADDEMWALAMRFQGRADNTFGLRTLKLFHGTSWKNAQSIKRNGFQASTEGRLGPGIYLGREDKARRFALDSDWHGGPDGGLVTVLVRIENPKFIRGEDVKGRWRREGYDACRTEYTLVSENMEWVILSPNQIIEVAAIERIPLSQHAQSQRIPAEAPAQPRMARFLPNPPQPAAPAQAQRHPPKCREKTTSQAGKMHLQEDDTLVLSFTGSCTEDPQRRSNPHQMQSRRPPPDAALKRAACAAVLQLVRPGTGAPLTLWTESRPLGKLCTPAIAAYMGLITGLRRLIRALPTFCLPSSSVTLILETDSENVCGEMTRDARTVDGADYFKNMAQGLLQQVSARLPAIGFRHKPRPHVAGGGAGGRHVEDPTAIGIHNGVAVAEAEQAMIDPYPKDSYIVFYPNLCCISRAVVEGRGHGARSTDCTNDVAAAGSSRKFLIDVEFLTGIPGFRDKYFLASLKDPGAVSVCSGKVPSTVLGLLPEPLRMCILWDGPPNDDNYKEQNVVVNEVYVVHKLPVPLHVSFNDETMQGWPGLSMSRDSIRPSRAVFGAYGSHPYWTDETMFISLPP